MPAVTRSPSVPAEAAFQQAAEIKLRWRTGSDPDAVAALEADAELAAVKSVVIDLAYEEYCLREQSGDAPDPEKFCARFPRYRTSIRKVLDAHKLVMESPDLLAADPVEWPSVGSRFEGLEVVGELGRGAFAQVYLMFDPATDRPCVLKLSAGHSVEARVIGSLRHEHVTDVYWARQVGGLYAVCMPLVGLTTLEEVRDAAFEVPAKPPTNADLILAAIEPVNDEPASRQPVVRAGESFAVGIAAIACRIADALRYLHERGTSHGDLKPSNVVLGPGGHPFLIDFNLSASGNLPPSAVGGTLPYMAPEQLRRMLDANEPAADPARADVYAFGALIFEILTGSPPFVPDVASKPKSAPATLLALHSAADRNGPALPAGTPHPLARVIRRCLVQNPAGRPAAAEVVRDLESYLRGARGERQPRRWLRAALLLCGVAMVAGMGWLARPQPAINVQAPVAEKDPETAEAYFARGRQFLAREQWPLAMSDFLAANRLKVDPNMMAFTAYCFSRMGQQESAALWGKKAIDAGGTSAEVYSNLGYSSMKVNHLKAAVPCLDQAVRLAPQLQAARYNRALLRHQIAISPGGPGFDRGAASDIEIALKASQLSAELYYDAAMIYAACAGREPDLRGRTLRCLAEAVTLGKNPAAIAREISFRGFSDNPEFQRILALKPGSARSPVNLRLVEPSSQ